MRNCGGEAELRIIINLEFRILNLELCELREAAEEYGALHAKNAT